ncbi:MAG: glycosyltransferase, partial [Nitrososphaeraceae archaeon]|nr:glycosyltransferase [Nitrososphaeraceae archaeon]
MLAKIIHDDLNAGGGSERLAITTLELLNEMGFEVDVQTCEALDVKKLENNFGRLYIKIRKTKELNLLSLLKSKENAEHGSDDCHYDLIINTHGDLLPYVSVNNDQSLFHNCTVNDNPDMRKTIMITYCHYPLLPYYVKNGVYRRFLCKFIRANEAKGSNSDNATIEKLLSNARALYDLTITNTVILTNSEYSKKSIKKLYDKTEPIVLNPPVDVSTFRKLLLSSKANEREDIILVVSRFSADKQVENAIEVAKILHNKKVDAKMIIVGNVSRSDMDYLQFLRTMIYDNNLNTYVKLEVGASFRQLLHLMSKSKVYLHPLAGEPFGISVAEAMAAGLIPVVPHVGGNSEFVPQKYHYGKLEEASEIISNALLSCFNDTYNSNIGNKTTASSTIANKSENELRQNLSNLVLKFSTYN